MNPARLVLLSLLAVLLVGAPSCGRQRPSPKILVIGLDGATWNLLTPWMDAGELPRLRALRDGGVWGTLLSVVPPLSPPAWTSATTGVNPGMHGIYDFHRLDPDSMVAYFETASSRRVPALWTLLSEEGKRVGVLNIPMTDPPDPVNGFQVAGMPHPDSVGYAYPPEVEEELHESGYRLDRMGEFLQEGHEADLREEIFDTFRRRQREALALGASHPDLDLYWVVFTGTDRVQHFFWKFMDKDNPYYDPDQAAHFGDTILDFYRQVDTAVGALVDQARAQAEDQGRPLAVIVLSDHGFYGVHRAFRPQSFLRHPPDGKPPITNAYSLEDNASMLYVPERGRERNGVLTPAEQDEEVDEILARILAVRDPQTGESPVLFGGKREDIFRGRYVDKAPDLVFVPRPPYYFVGEEGDKEPFGTPKFSFSGHHEPRGILIGWGSMFGRGHLEGKQNLLDVSPTLLYLAGEVVPGYMEGGALTDMFTKDFLDRHPLRKDETEARETGTDDQENIKAIPYLQ